MRYSDRNTALGLIVTAVLALLLFILADYDDTTLPATPAGSADGAPSTAPAGHAAGAVSRPPFYYAETPAQPAPTLFHFDPNTADSTALLRLGLSPWQVRSIYRYRSRGGVYRKKEDFARLYGLTVKEYRRLAPYIRISADYQPAATLFPREPRDTIHRRHKIDSTQHVVLNNADTAMLMTVPGIGPYFARRIVQYGQRLGGYVSTDQLDEIDQFPSAAKRYFTVSDAQPRRLNVNTLSLQELRRHPYINYYQAKAISDYRRLHGPLRSLDQLRLLTDFSDTDLRRLQPYVAF